MNHVLKIWPVNYKPLVEKRKKYEVRRADRPFSVNDVVEFKEWDPDHEKYTGREAMGIITYLTPGGIHGLPRDLCVFGIEILRSNAHVDAHSDR